MKLIKALSISLLLAATAPNQPLLAGTPAIVSTYGVYPDKTIVIKNPLADDMNAFLSGSKMYMFEVFKAGDAGLITKSFLKDKDVESCTVGKVTGDFTAITLTLKNTKNKAWFVSQFKKAGLNTIKVNHNDVTGVDKL